MTGNGMPFSSRFSTPAGRLALAALAVGAVGLLVAGCVRLLEPREADVRYYLLRGPEADTLSADTTGLEIGLRKPRLAGYLDPARIVARRGENEVHFSESRRWSESLPGAINRAVALHLDAQPGIGSVEVVPWPPGADFDYVVQLQVRRFEGTGPPPPGPEADDDAPIPRGRSQMTIHWIVYGPDGETRRAEGTTHHERDDWPVTNYEALVSRLETGLGVLAEDLEARLQALERR